MDSDTADYDPQDTTQAQLDSMIAKYHSVAKACRMEAVCMRAVDGIYRFWSSLNPGSVF